LLAQKPCVPDGKQGFFIQIYKALAPVYGGALKNRELIPGDGLRVIVLFATRSGLQRRICLPDMLVGILLSARN
jgi:hypothetical protein